MANLKQVSVSVALRRVGEGCHDFLVSHRWVKEPNRTEQISKEGKKQQGKERMGKKERERGGAVGILGARASIFGSLRKPYR